jgi:hypothetical protein
MGGKLVFTMKRVLDNFNEAEQFQTSFKKGKAT